MTRLIKFKYIAAAIAVIISALSLCAGGVGSVQFASAAASSYSDVLDDLKRDKDFNIEEYPVKAGDYGLYVKQIAETTGGELLIYVYQPAARQDIQACTINIAREMNNSEGLGFKDYGLEYLNNNGVFFKYRVLDFELKRDAIRYYNISNILRPFNNVIDDYTGNDNTVSEVKYRVGQFWTACTVAGEVTYTVEESEVIEITKKYVGHVNYDEGQDFGFTITSSATSAHFVAFSTDKPIDTLKSATLTFNECAVTYQLCANVAHTNALNGHKREDKFNYQYGTKHKHEPDPVKIDGESKVTDIGTKNYTWDRIRTTSKFLADTAKQDVKMTSGNIANLDGTQWVLNFYETPIEIKTNGTEYLPVLNLGTALINGVNDLDCRYTEVSDVMLLQLEFETAGKPYKLGVVDNKQTGSNTPWGSDIPAGFWEWLAKLLGVSETTAKFIFACAVVLIVLSIAMPILSAIFPAVGKALKTFFGVVWKGIKYFFKGLGLVFYYFVYGFWLIISAPFRLIANAVKKRKAAPKEQAGKSKPKATKKRKNRKGGKK